MPRIQKVLFCGRFWPGNPWLSDALARGLEANGVEVRRVGIPRAATRIGGHMLDRVMPPWVIAPLNRALLGEAESFKPDAVLIYHGLQYTRETIEELARQCWVSGYTNDDPFGPAASWMYWRHLRRALPAYSSWHVYREENKDEFRSRGVEHVGLLRSYYVPWMHSAPDLTAPDLTASDLTAFGHDVVFAGHAERDERLEHIRRLLAEGVEVKVFHPNARQWRRVLSADEFARVGPVRALRGDEYAKTIAAAKINLCFFSHLNRDRYTRRVFEIPACGGFLLAERTDVMQSLYREGVEAEFFDSAGELVDKTRHYLTHDAERLEIARRGHDRCVKDGHDAVSRMRQWLDDVDRWKGNEE